MNIVTPYTDIPYETLEPQDAYEELSKVKALQVGFGSRVLRVDRQGLWLGSDSFATAPFSVDMDGNVIITGSVTVTGYIPTGGALTDIGSGNITGTYIANGAITTAKLTATAIDGMTVTGALIRTSSSSTRVQLNNSNNSLEVRKSGTVRVSLDDDEIGFYNSSAAKLGYVSTPTATNFYIGATNGNYLVLEAEGSVYSIIFNIAGTQKGYFSSGGLTLSDDLNMDNNDIAAVRSITMQARNITNSSLTASGMIANTTNGGLDAFVGRPGNGTWTGTFDMTAW